MLQHLRDCSNSNNLVLQLKQCKATELKRHATGKSVHVKVICLFFQRKYLAKDAGGYLKLHPRQMHNLE